MCSRCVYVRLSIKIEYGNPFDCDSSWMCGMCWSDQSQRKYAAVTTMIGLYLGISGKMWMVCLCLCVSFVPSIVHMYLSACVRAQMVHISDPWSSKISSYFVPASSPSSSFFSCFSSSELRGHNVVGALTQLLLFYMYFVCKWNERENKKHKVNRIRTSERR